MLDEINSRIGIITAALARVKKQTAGKEAASLPAVPVAKMLLALDYFAKKITDLATDLAAIEGDEGKAQDG
jgi:mannose/fructose/N-acetylgalactosamine-specific phosphotransferase system component IIC